ncbi:MAG: hypothetical protein JWM05_3230 [Acidimicrobiales bacterium]|nr:hypothetical protein [Acidimicrobiales bacterium]
MTDARPADDPLVTTREALHAVAEHVLAPDLHRWNGRIGLRATPGGFGTPTVDTPDGPRRSRVDGTDLVLEVDGMPRRTPLRTLAEAAAFLDVPVGAPAGIYHPVTAGDPDVALVLDGPSAARLAGWYALVDRALAAFAAAPGTAEPSTAQLWPEHFDLAITAGEVSYGGSPGDAEHPEPYLYVGPWTVPDGPYWNEPFGASRPWSAVGTVEEALAYFAAGRAALG